MTRKRYDTEALVDSIQSSRRTSIIIVCAAILVAFGLVGFILTGSDNSISDNPINDNASSTNSVNKEDTAQAIKPAAVTTVKNTDSKEGHSKTAADAENSATENKQVAPPQQATLLLRLKKKGVLWIDGKKRGKLKKLNISLAAGPHTFVTKIRKKKRKHTINLVAGGNYKIIFGTGQKAKVIGP